MQTLQKVLIKGMVCQRCINVVKSELENIGIEPGAIKLGEIILNASITTEDAKRIEENLKRFGFSLLEDKKSKVVREIKDLVKKVYNGDYDFPNRFRFSELVSEKLANNYESLSMIFSSVEGITLEKFIITYRIEKIKEMLVYTDKTLEDISFCLGFSSVAHLSRQFKEQTGLNPSHFRSIRKKGERQ